MAVFAKGYTAISWQYSRRRTAALNSRVDEKLSRGRRLQMLRGMMKGGDYSAALRDQLRICWKMY